MNKEVAMRGEKTFKNIRVSAISHFQLENRKRYA